MTSNVLRALVAALLSGACLMGCKNGGNDGVGASDGSGGSGGSGGDNSGSGGDDSGSGGDDSGSGGDDSGSGGDDSGGGGCGEGSGGGCGLPPDEPCAVRDVEGTIPGVKISIESSRCAYREGEPAEFVYTVTTDSSVPPIDIAASTGCGRCVEPTSDPLSFVSYKISGTSFRGDPQTYCLCDVGCCPPDESATVQVDATTATQTIRWSGRQWNGPSDTSNPEGDFFAPGSYEVEVTFDGKEQGVVTAKLGIEIYP
ncbi:hypothetical protein WMF37_49945 [Sorangium sp. So ce291]|uniref:hypothetical protein n=1 Tax=Sorangium sp. So ce291 TaxID=3133294 RepID=UPI003F62C19C